MWNTNTGGRTEGHFRERVLKREKDRVCATQRGLGTRAEVRSGDEPYCTEGEILDTHVIKVHGEGISKGSVRPH